LISSIIEMTVDGEPTASAVPGKIAFRVNSGDSSSSPPVAMSIRSGGHVQMENTLGVENQITAEAFYVKKGGEVRPWNVNDDHFYISKDSDSTSIINLKHEVTAKHITLQSPARNEDITWFVSEENFIVKDMISFLRTEDSGFYPFVDFSIRYGSGIPTTPNGTELTTDGWRIGFYPGHPVLTENPLSRVTFDNPNISKGDFVWLRTNNIGEGNSVEQELHVTLIMKRD